MIILKYRNAQLQIGLADWKKAYQFPQQQLLHYLEVYPLQRLFCDLR